jgi:hypothetical protein
MTHPPHLVLVLRADAPPPVRARTAGQLSEVARCAGTDLVNRAISAALPMPAAGAVVVRCDGVRCVRLDVREPLAEQVTLRTA